MNRKVLGMLFSLPLVAVLALTLLLLVYIGWGEVKRKYPKFESGKLIAQGEIIKNSLDRYLQSGLSLKQYSGFTNQTNTLLRSDNTLESFRLLNSQRKPIFTNVASDIAQEDLAKVLKQRVYSEMEYSRDNILVEESNASFRVTLSLKNKFVVAGYLIVESRKDRVFAYLEDSFSLIFNIFLGLNAFFAAFVIIYEALGINRKYKRRSLEIVYLICFLIMSSSIGAVIFKIYEHGATARAAALSGSLSERLSVILDLGIDFSSIEGINNALQNYQRNNPDISNIAILKDNNILFHTDQTQLGKVYTKPSDVISQVSRVGSEESIENFAVIVSLPENVIFQEILSRGKAFLVLLIACGLISALFLDAGTTLMVWVEKREISQQKKNDDPHLAKDDESFQMGLRLVKPAYFLVVFVNALAVSFLPQLVKELASETNSSSATASLPFTIFYFFFAMVLVPAGQYAENGDLKKLMAVGFFSELVGLLLIGFIDDYWFLTIGRCFSGIGQGLFLIGLQSYILAITPQNKRTQGAAVKVIGRNAGLISGTAIGALLYSYMDYQTLFLVSAAVSMISIVYLWVLVPSVDTIVHQAQMKSKTTVRFRRLLQNIISCLKDAEFVKTLMCLSLIGKAAITGVVMFAVPLVLSINGFTTEEIGQLLMLYYISSMVVTHYASRTVDALGNTKSVLFLSAMIGAVSMAVLGMVGFTSAEDVGGMAFLIVPLANLALEFNKLLALFGLSNLATYIVLVCLLLAGASNGLLAAPVLTHINKTRSAERFGNKSITATYIFLERIGHVIGPLLSSLLFVITNDTTIAIALYGIVTGVLGLIFIMTTNTK